MAKRRFGMTEKKIDRFAREGRGTGKGMEYKPWLTVHDLSSLGRSARMLGRCNRRIHHLFSDVERSAFLEYDYKDEVQDIREQYPLDRQLTGQIALSLGVSHPMDVQTGVDIVMTTDLLVTFRDGKTRAVACKRSNDLQSVRTLEKLEIERRYWKTLGVDWKLWTEGSTTKVRVQNLAFLHEFLVVDDRKLVDPTHWVVRSAVFLKALNRTDLSTPFADFAAAFERSGGFPPGEGIATMRYLACRKQIEYDLDVVFDHTKPIGRSIRPLQTAAAAVAV
jgi:hypothetical protein